jgi:glutathionylspermidine synthase
MAASVSHRIASMGTDMATAMAVTVTAAGSTLPMQRIVCPERDDWRATAESSGFDFHTIDGERYWDERAYYGFTLEAIERQIEQPTGEIDAMCLELVGRAIEDENYLRRLKIPEIFWPLISASWHNDEASLYGRLDLSFDGRSPAKLLEYNADTPTSIFEAAVFQWTWLEQAIERNIIPNRADQFNSIHERLIEAWKKLGGTHHLHLAGMTESTEDAGTLAYLEDTATQAGLSTTLIDIEDIGLSEDGRFVDLDNRVIELAFKLYPWEWMFRDVFGAQLLKAPTRWIEPPWKAILSNKGILPLLWEMFPNHPNLLPAYFEDDPNAARLGTSFVRKPLYSREGANVALVSAGATLVEQEGPYGAEGFIRQAFASLPDFSGQYPVLGSWLVDHTPCGLSIREDENPITGNTSRFLPHAIL